MRINEDFFDEQTIEKDVDSDVNVSDENIVLTVFFQSIINNKKSRIDVMNKIVPFIERKGSVMLFDIQNTYVVFPDEYKQNVSIRFYIKKTQQIRNLFKFITQISKYLLFEQRGLLSFFCECKLDDSSEEQFQLTNRHLKDVFFMPQAPSSIAEFCENFADLAQMCCGDANGAEEYAKMHILK